MRAFRIATLVTIAVCAALYAVAIAATAFIPTPWGVGHFRPGVVVPAVFAVISGPWVAGLGAALGTFIGSFILQAAGTGLGPLGSLVSGSPANFIGFYLFGWMIHRYKSWRAFIAATFVALIVGNLVAASGVMFYLTHVIPRWAPLPLESKLGIILGLTLFWVVTMLPFIFLVPAITRALARLPAHPMIQTTRLQLSFGSPWDMAYPSIAIASFLAFVYYIVEATPYGSYMFSLIVQPQYLSWAKALFIAGAAITLAFSAAVGLIAAREGKPIKVGG